MAVTAGRSTRRGIVGLLVRAAAVTSVSVAGLAALSGVAQAATTSGPTGVTLPATTTDATGATQAKSADPTAPTGVLLGSNGTVKVDGAPFDGGADPGNEPHVGCSFRLDFYGFDAGTDDATVAFTAQPPSGSGTVIRPLSGPTSFSFTGLGPGNDLDNTPDSEQTYQLDTRGLTATQQGFHVRISTTVTNSAGVTTFAKTKVVWVADCTPPAPPTLAGVCDTGTGHVTWTVTNPDTVDLTGTWTVGGQTGTVSAPAGSTGQFVSTTGGTATVDFGGTGLTAGPVTVACSPQRPRLAPPTLAGVCDAGTGLVTWTLTNPDDTVLSATWHSGSATGTVTVPARGSATFTTDGGAVTVTFPEATGLSAVSGSRACVLAVSERAPDLAIHKTASAASTRPGRTLTYTLTVRNVGAGPTTSTVTVTDVAPATLRPIAASGTGWSCDVAGQTVTCTWTGGAVAPGQRLPAITVTTTVRAGASGTIRNTGVVSTPGDHDRRNDRSTATTRVRAVSTSVLGERLTQPAPAGATRLPFTGARAAGLVPYALGMVMAGLLLLLVGRRRRTT